MQGNRKRQGSVKLLGIHGKARSGKDELCKILCEGFGFKRASYADKIKQLALDYFGLKIEEVYETKTKDSRQILQGLGNCVRESLNYAEHILRSTTRYPIGVSKFPVWVETLAIAYFGIKKEDLKSRRKYIKSVLSGIHNMFAAECFDFCKVSNGDQRMIWINYLNNSLSSEHVYVITDVRYKNEKIEIEKLNGVVIKLNRTDLPQIEAGSTHISENDLDTATGWFYEITNEHKSDWRHRLVQNGTNLVRKLASIGFLESKHIDKFMINIKEY